MNIATLRTTLLSVSLAIAALLSIGAAVMGAQIIYLMAIQMAIVGALLAVASALVPPRTLPFWFLASIAFLINAGIWWWLWQAWLAYTE